MRNRPDIMFAIEFTISFFPYILPELESFTVPGGKGESQDAITAETADGFTPKTSVIENMRLTDSDEEDQFLNVPRRNSLNDDHIPGNFPDPML